MLVPNEKENAFVFTLPLKSFLTEKRLKIQNQMYGFNGEALHTHHYIDFVDNRKVDIWGFTAYYCVAVAPVAYQSEKKFCFLHDHIITNDNVLQTQQQNNEISDETLTKSLL